MPTGPRWLPCPTRRLRRLRKGGGCCYSGPHPFHESRKQHLATPNYGYEKRQRELAKKQKKEDKLRAKAQRKSDEATHPEPLEDEAPGMPPGPGTQPPEGGGTAA